MAEANGRLPGPLLLEPSGMADNWRRFIQQFEIYLVAYDKSRKPEATQVNLLLHAAGPAAIEVFNTFEFEAGKSPQVLEHVKEKFAAYCEGKKNVSYERYVFNQRNQKPSESIDQYITEIMRLSKNCEFDTLKDSLIRDRIICGVLSDDLRGRLLRQPDLDLKTAVDMCRAHESSHEQIKLMTTSDQTISAVQRKSRYRGDKDSERKAGPGFKECKFCGLKHKFDHPSLCPAYKKVCNKCGLKNHFARKCINKPQRSKDGEKTVNPLTRDSASSDSSDEEESAVHSYFVDTVNISDVSRPSKTVTRDPMVKIVVNGKQVKMKADTGAEVNVLPLDVYKRVSSEPLKKVKTKLCGWLGPEVRPLGKARLQTEYKGKKIALEYVVVDETFTPLLGLDSCVDLDVIKFYPNVLHSVTKKNIQCDPVLKNFPDRFEGLSELEKEVHLELSENACPVVHPPRRLPLALMDAVKQKLEEMVKDGVAVKEDGPTEWVNSMVVVDKRKKKKRGCTGGQPPSADEVRICIDPKDLNHALKRHHYPTTTVEEVATRLSGAKLFTTLDAQSGFWQIKLDEESSKLTTFNTPWGRYRFLRMPFGVKPAPEIFQKAMHDIFQGVPVEIIVDDLCVSGKTLEVHDRNLTLVLERARQENLTFNLKKLKIRVDEVKYSGHVLTSQGLKPDPDKIKAIREMPAPTDKAGVQRFLGMVNYLAKFLPDKSSIDEPLRQLIQDGTEFVWEEPQQSAMDKLKTLVTVAPILTYFDSKKELVLSVDASSSGLGAEIRQEGHPIAYASKSLTDCQKRYAQIEKELLAIQFGAERFHTYIYGRPVLVETDHKPLESIFLKPLSEAPPRLQRMLLRLQQYNLIVKYKKGKELYVADTLSRAQLPVCEQMDEEIGINLVTNLNIQESSIERFRSHTQTDPVLQKLQATIMKGWPNEKSKVEPEILDYWFHRETLSCADGLVFKSNRLVVPKTLRREILAEVHGAHMGEKKTLRLARDYVFWPRMSSQIKDLVASCPTCNCFRKNQQQEPLLQHEVPSGPWKKVGIDLFSCLGDDYCLFTDYFSKFFEINKLQTLTAMEIIEKSQQQFARYGIPDHVISDNGTQFNSYEFKEFAADWKFSHTSSSPEFAQSNGMVERYIQICKGIIKKAHKKEKTHTWHF